MNIGGFLYVLIKVLISINHNFIEHFQFLMQSNHL